MDNLILIAVLAGMACVLTQGVCRQSLAKHRFPSFFLAVIAALCTAFIMVLIFYGQALFTRRFWDDDKMIILVPMAFTFSAFVGLIPASLVVVHHRKRFKDAKHMD